MILYIVATPIGNLEDLTLRATRILSEVDIIAAEDTRHSAILLRHLNIKKPMYSCHKFNEAKKINFFLEKLTEGKTIALISDAGTPCISDPGHRLVHAAAEIGIKIIPICGASAVMAALSVSGFNITEFTFLGFLSKNHVFKPGLSVFYESPRRIHKTLMSIPHPTADICVCNDLTKKFEQIYCGNIKKVLQELTENPNMHKGEYTCVINIPNTDEPSSTDISIESQIVDHMVKHNTSLKEAMEYVHKQRKDLSKREVYSAMLALKRRFNEKEN